MKKNNTLLLIGLGAAAYFLFKSKGALANTYDSGGGYGGGGVTPSGFDAGTSFTTTALPKSINVQSSTPTGSLRTTTISSPAQGVAFINANWGNLQPTGKTLRKTGANSTISQLGTGQIVSIKATPVKKGTSFFDRPIRTINGKRTRVY